jgi:hypothetical protein
MASSDCDAIRGRERLGQHTVVNIVDRSADRLRGCALRRRHLPREARL